MADLQERIAAEEENIQQVLERLPGSGELKTLSELELAGTAAKIGDRGLLYLSSEWRERDC